ncbi:hypothetical protein [Nostoc sp. NMS8]|uniref:hypothetical protein n=1 Tax=Nostoc sp. NMS8 TaxID=2815392 RepID=UPI0025E15F58|nr:hypothetical protein [Nostoc sp. NMS8]MBN3958378.1 hypothetical protein [Nostoc sp. NMS8]
MNSKIGEKVKILKYCCLLDYCQDLRILYEKLLPTLSSRKEDAGNTNTQRLVRASVSKGEEL